MLLDDLEEIGSDETPARPTPLRVLLRAIPAALQAFIRWVVWNYELDVRGKWTKVPYVATEPQRKASSTNPATWRTLNDVLAAYEDGKCDGIGFVLGQYGDLGDRVVGVDLDHCVDKSGHIAAWAQDIIDHLNSYTELSPSGTGIRIFVLADGLPGGGRKKGPIEMYVTGRYLTVTGQHIEGTPTQLCERSDALTQLHTEVFAPEPAMTEMGPTAPAADQDSPLALSDDDLLARAKRSKNGTKFIALWKGVVAGYGSHSEADSALCCMLVFWYQKDAARVDRLFRRSGLMRPKWDEQHGANTYGQITIANAIAQTDEVFVPRGNSFKKQLVDFGMRNDVELFHGPDGLAYASVPVADHRETMSLSSRTFGEWLSRENYNSTKKVVGTSELKDAIRILSANARHDGAQHDVYIRVARVGDVIWLDLGRPTWDAIKITRDGWFPVGHPDVKFRRSRGLLALPLPIRGAASLEVMLKTLINVIDPRLMIAWLVGALRGRKPYPVLNVNGEQGTAKTYACCCLRRIIDPNTANLRTVPKDARDLMIAAHNSHVIGYDNLSVIPDWLSDDLCKISTGGGFSTRELFSDLDETLFSAERPIVFNGINDVVTRPDLLDRSLVVTLELIPEDRRRSESNLDAAFANLHPAILAALLDAVVVALQNEAITKLAHLPRMADFATWMVAASPALGWEPEEFLEAYRQNQQDALDSVLDGDVVVDAIKELLFTPAGTWTGQLKELLNTIPDHEHKPKSPRGLRSALRRKAPALRRLGITMTFTRGHVKTIEIRRADESLLALEPTPYQEEPPF